MACAQLSIAVPFPLSKFLLLSLCWPRDEQSPLKQVTWMESKALVVLIGDYGWVRFGAVSDFGGDGRGKKQ